MRLRRPVPGIELKTSEQIALMRAAGLVVARTLAELTAAARPGVTARQLDVLAERTIRAQGAVPSFLGYHGFPASICYSPNETVVHGIPRADQVLADGDLLSVDCGAVLDGWHGDAAVTIGIGDVDRRSLRMAEVCEDALWAGIAAVRPGGRLTDIGAAVERSVRRAPGRYGIVTHYGGHGIGTEMHQDPHVENHGRPGRGPVLLPGAVLAIEPMITLGSPMTAELSDGWTVVTRDSSRAAHVEHTVALTEDGPWVLTAMDGGRSRLGGAASSLALTG